MAKIFAHMRLIAGALALAFVVATAMPAAAQQPSSVNPTAAAVKEQQLLEQLQRHPGPRHHSGREVLRARASGRPRVARIPHGHAEMDRRHRHLRHSGAAHGRTIRGTAPCASRQGRSGRTIVRFNAFERFVHWLTAVYLRHPGDHRPQHQLRPQPDPAVAGPVGVQRHGRNGRSSRIIISASPSPSASC